MVEKAVLNSIHAYLTAVQQAGIFVNKAILFGSFARGDAGSDSDIDLIIVSEQFDTLQQKDIDTLWELRVSTDARIEPIACGEQQWQEDDFTPILEVARREGIVIEPRAEPA